MATSRGYGGKTSRRGWGDRDSYGSSARSKSAHGTGGPVRAKHAYLAVYDGHGGREAVDYIERNLHARVAKQLKAGSHPTQALEAAFLETDAAMQATRQYQDSGSTVASAVIRPSVSRAGQRDLFVANVGDARAVVAVASPTAGSPTSPSHHHHGYGHLHSPGGGAGSAPLQAVRLSRDHTPHDPLEAARVRREGGMVSRGRVDGQLAVSRALGDHSLKSSGVSALPDQTHLPLTKDHKYMIIGCDGLWDVMTDHEAVNLIAGMKDANKMAQKLVKTAMQRGTTDKSVEIGDRLTFFLGDQRGHQRCG